LYKVTKRHWISYYLAGSYGERVFEVFGRRLLMRKDKSTVAEQYCNDYNKLLYEEQEIVH